MTNTVEIIRDTFNILEDLARKGIIQVTINRPPKEYASIGLPGLYALIPVIKKNYYPSDLLWRTVDNHGGHGCGNGLGLTPDKNYYWCQSQVNRTFFTGSYTWVGQDTNDYRKWDCPEIIEFLLHGEK